MKKQKTFFLICSLSFCLSLSALSISIPVFSHNINFLPASGYGKITYPDPSTDTLYCLNEIPDSVLKFVRYDHYEGEISFYNLKLSMLGLGFERYYFYQNAWEHELYMTDKSEFFNDSALFTTSIPEKERVLSLISELYLSSKNANRSFSDDEKNEIIRASPFHKMIEFQGSHPPLVPPYIGCDSAKVACSSNIYSFPAGTKGQAPPSVNGYPNYGCLTTYPGPAWYFMQVSQAGDIIIHMLKTGGLNNDIDFICWGPFSSLSDGCASGLTGTCGNGKPPTCCNNNSPGCYNFYPRGNITDCSYSPLPYEDCHILNAQVGDIYILLITNFSMQIGTITFSQTGGSGVTNCNIVYHCSIISITADTSSCDPFTNTFSVSGNIEFTNPPPTGTLTLTDHTASPPVSQTFNSPFTSPLPYSLTNIPCDGLIHSLTALFSDSLNCILSRQYTSPSAVCPQAHISGGGIICEGTEMASVSVDFPVGIPPFNFTYAIDGVNQTSVNNYNGPFPYVLTTNTPGTYTLVSLSDASCTSGAVSGTATVTVKPVPVITNPAIYSECSGVPLTITLTSSPPGNSSTYSYTVSCNNIFSGCPSNGSGSTLSLNPVVSSASPGTVTYYVSPSLNGCTGSTDTITVTVNPNPTPVVSGDNPVCSGSTGHTYHTTDISGDTYSWEISGGTITAGAASSTITVNWGTGSSGWVKVTETTANSCSVTTNAYNVTINPNPSPVITGSATPCGLSTNTYTVGTLQANYSYQWTVTGGTPVSGTNSSIDVTWGNTNPVSISMQESVTYPPGLVCSSAAPAFPVTLVLIPDAAGTISGQSAVCQTLTKTYTVAPIGNADSYTWWYVPSAGITITNNGTSVNLLFDLTSSSGNLYVKGNKSGCASGPSSPAYPITVNTPPYVFLSLCNDGKTTSSSRPFNLKGGVPPGGQYYIDGNLISTGIFDPWVLSTTSHQVTYSYTDHNTCVNSSSPVAITIIPGSQLTSCPSTFTDPRNNKTYRSARMGTRCWMLENLSYGNVLTPVTQEQRDNCTAEKYCLTTDPSCTNYGGLYQWDELMQYQVPAPGQYIQGLCPPEWHVPTAAEWQLLIDGQTNAGNGIAGADLKDTVPVNGFRGLLKGLYYQNNYWAFLSGSSLTATMFWTSTTIGNTKAVARGLNVYNESVSRYVSLKSNALPVRCVKD